MQMRAHLRRCPFPACKAILYGLVKERQEVSFPEAAGILGLTEDEVRREFAVLRHLELLRACRRDDLILLTLF